MRHGGGASAAGGRLPRSAAGEDATAAGSSSGAGGAPTSVSAEVPVKVLVRCRPAVQQSEARCMRITASPSSIRGQATLRVEPPPSPASPSSRLAVMGGGAWDHRSFRCNAFLDERARQEDVFAHAAGVVDRVMEGFNGTILCYGITGTGKTYTMCGPPAEDAPETEHGIAQRVARRLFEFVAAHGERGEVFAVDASFLEVCPDGPREVLVDLLAEEHVLPQDAPKLDVRQDPLNARAFVCEGLRRVPISSPAELCQVLTAGRRRCATMETSRNQMSSRSHCLLTVHIERLAPTSPDFDDAVGPAASPAPSPRDCRGGAPGGAGVAAGAQHCVRCGKLVLVDLAGSESLKKVAAAEYAQEDLRRKQAIGINKALANLGVVVHNLNAGFDGGSAGFRSSALTMLLKDCLGGRARALLVATVSPEADWSAETFTTLTFAQNMLQVHSVERVTYFDESKSSLLQMQRRRSDCERALKEAELLKQRAGQQHAQAPSHPSDAAGIMQEAELQRLQTEVAAIGRRLLTKDLAERTIEEMRAQRWRSIDEVRDELSQAMSREFAALQEHSSQDLEDLKRIIEEKASESREAVARMQRELLQAKVCAPH